MIQRVSTSAPWETAVGYCRALRSGDHFFVSGTAPVEPDGRVHAPGDAYAQAKRCVEIITRALQQLGARPEHVARTRMFVTDISRWQEFGRAHAEVFAHQPPVTTMVQVAALIDPAMLIEIEAEGIVRS
jgi:isochorismate pyruvate lyase